MASSLSSTPTVKATGSSHDASNSHPEILWLLDRYNVRQAMSGIYSKLYMYALHHMAVSHLKYFALLCECQQSC